MLNFFHPKCNHERHRTQCLLPHTVTASNLSRGMGHHGGWRGGRGSPRANGSAKEEVGGWVLEG